MKTALLWIVDWSFCRERKGGQGQVSADLFFSSKEKFRALYGASNPADEQLVKVNVPDDFDDWDYIPENY
jgi:hypothetical protein